MPNSPSNQFKALDFNQAHTGAVQGAQARYYAPKSQSSEFVNQLLIGLDRLAVEQAIREEAADSHSVSAMGLALVDVNPLYKSPRKPTLHPKQKPSAEIVAITFPRRHWLARLWRRSQQALIEWQHFHETVESRKEALLCYIPFNPFNPNGS